jgi:hypothetical protein
MLMEAELDDATNLDHRTAINYDTGTTYSTIQTNQHLPRPGPYLSDHHVVPHYCRTTVGELL